MRAVMNKILSFVKKIHWMYALAASSCVFVFTVLLLGFLWDDEPESFNVALLAKEARGLDVGDDYNNVVSFVVLRNMIETLTHKGGGLISNDVFFPGVWMDNIPNWESGALIQIRAYVGAVKSDLKKGDLYDVFQSAYQLLMIPHQSWRIPSVESEYRKAGERIESAINHPRKTTKKLSKKAFKSWLVGVEKDIDNKVYELISNRSFMSDGEQDIEELKRKDLMISGSSRLNVDNVFYQARGMSWAIIQILEAAVLDYDGIIDKSELEDIRSIVTYLKLTQNKLWSPVVLNGDGMGVLANHSITLASYLNQANKKIRRLVKRL
jgi:hypothetical protein